MYSTLSHCSQETLSTKNVLTGRSPHGGFEHLLTDGAVEIIFGVGRGRGELLGHAGGRRMKAMAAAAAKVAVAARGLTPCANPKGEGNRFRKLLAPGSRRGPGGRGPGGAGPSAGRCCRTRRARLVPWGAAPTGGCSCS